MYNSLNDLCILPLIGCFVLTLMYVMSLYIWHNAHLRNDPSVIKKRFISVTVTSLISPFGIRVFSIKDITLDYSIFEIVGIRMQGLLTASTLPLAMTIILFLGPLSMKKERRTWKKIFLLKYWIKHIDLIWLRHHIFGPFSEELTFRACMLPLLLQCFRPHTTILICPIFFGLAHFHHCYEKLRTGVNLKVALTVSSFQVIFTTIFGVYSTFLFLRTGHIIAPFLVHAFCNSVGFPNFLEILRYKEPNRSISAFLCVLGLGVWYWVLMPWTDPKLYGNEIYWEDEAFR